jgi:YVTN family beta-propeller protein
MYRREMEVSLETFKPGRELEVGDRPANMAMDLKRNSLLVLDELSDNLSVIDRATFKRKKLISVSKKPVDIEIDQTGNYAYIASDGDGLVDILSLDSLALVGTITNVGRPGKLFTYPRENLLLLLDEFNNRLHVIDTLKNQVKSSIDVVNLPTSMDVDTERDLVYVTSFTDSQVGVIDLNQEKMVEVIQLRALFDSVSGLNNVALDADLGQIIVTNTVTGQVFMVKVQ